MHALLPSDVIPNRLASRDNTTRIEFSLAIGAKVYSHPLQRFGCTPVLQVWPCTSLPLSDFHEETHLHPTTFLSSGSRTISQVLLSVKALISFRIAAFHSGTLKRTL